eukprot:g6746.t1
MEFGITTPQQRVVGLRCLVAGVPIAVWFPMSLRFAVGNCNSPDLRIQALELVAGSALNSTHEATGCQRGFFGSLRRFLCLAGRLAAMTALQFLLPGLIPAVQKVLCISGLLSIFIRTPSVMRKLDMEHLNQDLSPAFNTNQETEWNGQIINKTEFSFELFYIELLLQMHIPMVLFYSLGGLWNMIHPESQYYAECGIALSEIDRNYKQLSKKISRGRICGDGEIEKAWLNAHKHAAQKVAHLQRALPDNPPLKSLIEFWQRHDVQIGRFINDFDLPVSSLNQSGALCIIWNINQIPTGPNQRSQELHIEQRRRIREIHEFPLEAELAMSRSVVCADEEDEDELKLYGVNDHTHVQLTGVQKLELSVRGVQLFFAFLPFLLLGLFLLLLAYSIDSHDKNSAFTRTRSGDQEDVRITSKRKKLVNQMRLAAFERLLQSCRDGGAAFIKWGQWSSSREDLFPTEFCDVLSELHDQAPVHSIKATRKEILKAYGRSIEEIFDSFDYKPLASGSVAQVHRATYRTTEGCLIPVVVKVRHPNVGLAERMPALGNLPLKESVSQFSCAMTAQTDFRVEAAHMERFWNNFFPLRNSVIIPKVIPELVTESVLVETYEEGRSVSHFIRNPSHLNTKIVTLGVDTYLRMLLSDNFVHTDLHPGNILVRETPSENSVQIVLLDFGLAEELRPKIRKHFISFLNMISKGDGYSAAQHLLQWSDDQQCPDPVAFTEEMQQLFAAQCNIKTDEGVDLDLVMKSVLRLARKHHVSIDSGYASLVIGVCIIVGFAQALDPRVNLLDAATPVLLAYSMTGKVVGRLYG